MTDSRGTSPDFALVAKALTEQMGARTKRLLSMKDTLKRVYGSVEQRRIDGMTWRTNRKTGKRFLRGVDTEYGSLIRTLKRKHPAGRDIGARNRGQVRDVWILAVRKLLKQSPESVAEFLSRELGRGVTVDGMFAQLSRYRNSNVGKVEEWITGSPSENEIGITVPTIHETGLNAEANRERAKEAYEKLTPEQKANRAAMARLERVNVALEDGRISQADYPRYVNGELKLPRGKNVKAKTVTAETVEVETVKVESSKLPSDAFFDDTDSQLAGEQ